MFLKENLNFSKYFKRYFFVFLIFLLSLVPYFWFSGGDFINSGDLDFSVYPDNDILRFSSSWNPDNLGKPGNGPAKLALFQVPINILYLLGFELGTIQKVWFFSIFFISGFGMYFLIKELFKNKEYSNAVAFIAANMYMFNHFTLIVKWSNGYILSLSACAILPFILYFFIKYLNSGHCKYLCFLALFSLFGSPAGVNIAHFIVIPGVVCLFSFWSLFFEKNKLNILKRTVLSLLLIFLINIFWISQVPSMISNYYVGAFKSYRASTTIAGLSSLLDVFRGMGKDIFFGSYKDFPYFPYASLYNTSHFLFIGYFISILSLTFLFFKNKDKNIYLFFFIFLVSIFLMKGSIEPLASWNTFFYDKFYFLGAFKHSYEKFGVFYIFSFAILLAYSLMLISYKFKNKVLIFLIYFFTFLFINIYNFPFFTGDIFPRYLDENILMDARVSIPSYYEEMSTSHSLLDYKTLGLPFDSRLSWVPYTWGYYGFDPLWHYNYNKPYFLPTTFENRSSNPIDKFYLMRDVGDYDLFFSRLSGISNVNRIILRNDVKNGFYDQIDNPKDVKDSLLTRLTNNSYLESSKNVGLLEVYDINKKYFLPHFYTSSNVLFSDHYLENFNDIIIDEDIRSIVYLKDQNNKNFSNSFLDRANYNLSFNVDILNKKGKIDIADIDTSRDFSIKKYLYSNPLMRVSYIPGKGLLNFYSINEGFVFNDEYLKEGDEFLSYLIKEGDSLKLGNDAFDLSESFSENVRLIDNMEIYKNIKTVFKTSFSDGTWQDIPSDCSNTMPGIPLLNMKLSDDLIRGNKSLELGSRNHTACTAKNFQINLVGGKVYKYSFDYKSVRGGNVKYYYNLIFEKGAKSFTGYINIDNNDWNRHNIYILPENDVKSITFYFYAPSDGLEEVVNRFNNLEITEVELVNNLSLGKKSLYVKKKLNLLPTNNFNYFYKEQNLLTDSFEGGLWNGEVIDCADSLPSEPDLYMLTSSDYSEGAQSLELGSRNHSACTSKRFSVNLTKGKIYKYSFDYKSVKGNLVKYYYRLEGDEKKYPFSENIQTESSDWNHKEIFIEPKEDINSIVLFFYASSDGSEEIINRFDNVTLEEWATKDIYDYYLYSSAKKKVNTPYIEFKKISTTKYRLKIHKASDYFPLVFSENFNSGWRAYLMSGSMGREVNIEDLNDYKIFEGSEYDQASKEELVQYIEDGLISTLGDGREKKIVHYRWDNGNKQFDHEEVYSIGFISKNFKDTIQNDNLKNGYIFDTWFKNSLKEESHLVANGFANSWWIDVEEICKNSTVCIKNEDGTYDFEMVIEYLPQQYFYIGLFISSVTLIVCVYYLFSQRRKKWQKK